MQHIKAILALAGLLASAGLGRAQTEAQFGIIAGDVTYLSRMALPPDAVVHVRLVDVTALGRPGAFVAAVAFPSVGKQVPLPFRLPYLRSSIAEGHRYAIHASIIANGTVLFAGSKDWSTPADGGGADEEVVTQPAPPNPPIEGTNWRLINIHGETPVAESREAPFLMLAAQGKRLSGATGCNNFAGTYELNGTHLRLKPGALTMMMCLDPLMRQERLLLDALKGTTSYRITGRRLQLMHGPRILAQFEADESG